MNGSLTATTFTSPCSTLWEFYQLELRKPWDKKGIAGYIRIAEDDSTNSTETVDADEGFRHNRT